MDTAFLGYKKYLCPLGGLYNNNLLPKIKLLEEDNIVRTMKIFDSLFILKKIILDNTIWSNFMEKLDYLITAYRNDVDLELIGFPTNYLRILRDFFQIN